MAKKIASSWMRLFSEWSYSIFLLLLVLFIGAQGLFLYDTVSRFDSVLQSVPALNLLQSGLDNNPPFALLTVDYVVTDSDGMILTEGAASAVSSASGSTIPDESSSISRFLPQLRDGNIMTGPVPARFFIRQNRVWLAFVYRSELADMTPVQVRYAVDLTPQAGLMVLLYGGGFVLFTISLGIIGLQGRFMTRRNLRTIDELTGKISAISSQNLNLRLNVSDSSDELINLAVTFNRMMERLERSYEKQNRFVSDASHELRTPISVIQGYARMLDRWRKNDPAILEESITAISKESRNMQDLVEKLLFLARNDRDSLVIVMETFDMTELVEEIGRETTMLETGHVIDCRTQPGVMLNGDRNRIKQALRVFIDNALKYTDKTGTISLRLAVRNGMAEATVQDTGIGIPEKDLPNVFDRFFRIDEARERNTGGHGLGLSIARIIVLRHGGKITVGSRPGAGTRFTVHLPLVREGVYDKPSGR